MSPILRAHRKCPRGVSSAIPKFKGTHVREQKLSELIVEKVGEAQEVCQENESSEECRVAWDEVEEVSQAKAHLRQRSQKQDPLESYCKENPETDECRIYEDWWEFEVVLCFGQVLESQIGTLCEGFSFMKKNDVYYIGTMCSKVVAKVRLCSMDIYAIYSF